ncbi:MAG TPA: YncE family protein [Gemmatimonadaceae bacterium]|nr:YncE family protein [Gemmatimonadaceae bacterium]
MHIRLLLAAAVAASGSAGAQVPGLSGTLVVTNKGPSTATIIDVASGRTLATLPTGSGPHEVVLSGDGRWAVVTDYGAQQHGHTLTVIDVPALRIARTIDLGQYTRPHGIAFLPGDSLVVVTSETTGNIVTVSIPQGTVRRAIPTQARGSHMVAVTGSGDLAYTGNIGSNTVTEFDLRTGQSTRSWSVPEQPEAINVTPDGREVWVGSNATGRVSVVEVANGQVTTAAEGFGWPYRIHYAPDGRTVLLPDLRNEQLRFLDRASRRELGRIAFPGGAPQGIVITPDGRHAFQSLSREARVAIVDVASRSVIGHLAAGGTPDGVAYTRRVVGAAPGQGAAASAAAARPQDVASIDAIIAALYDVISGPAGQKRDWDRFRSLFTPGARLVPTGRRPDSTRVIRVISPDEYATNIGPQLENGGFFEREIGRRTEQFGNIAHVFSAYDSRRTAADTTPFARGINSIQLFNDGRRWWVVSIFWDSERRDNPIPAEMIRRR